jgi:ATP-binding cassette subfamily B protein
MGMLWPSLEFILGVSMVITLLAGGHLVIENRITVGQFVEFNTYMILLIWPIIAVGWVVNLFQRGTASVKRIDELLKAEPAIDDRSADKSIGPDTAFQGDIDFRNLNFAAHSSRHKHGHRRSHRLGQNHSGKPDLKNV